MSTLDLLPSFCKDIPLFGVVCDHRSACCPHSSCFLACLRALYHGFRYGAKVRFPHALVMTFLFREGSLKAKIIDIFQATFQHSRNLGFYACFYKFLTCLFRNLRQKDDAFNVIIAGFIGGAIMFGTNTPINSQINMYVMSRVIFGIAKLLATQHESIANIPHAFTMFSAVTWALVMYLFEYHAPTLQKSLASSMQYLYKDPDAISGKATTLLQLLLD